MCLTTRVRENALVESLVSGFARSPAQLNVLGESDAELVRLAGSDLLLALTTDAVVEEIEAGLYSDPYLVGWMTVVASASDLAAVGADPLGILLNQTLPRDADGPFLEGLQQGARDACGACGLHLLGGDTNVSDRLHVAGTAVGTVPAGLQLTRSGGRPGDQVFASGPLGLGSAFALSVLWGDGAPDASFLPLARIAEGRMLRGMATCCMDTSDGALATLDEIMRRSAVGIKLTAPTVELLHPAARQAADAHGLPPWTLLAGPHGEFELLFFVKHREVDRLQRAARDRGWDPLHLGEARARIGLELSAEDGCLALDTGAVRNLASLAPADPDAFVSGLLALEGAAYAGA